MIRNASPAGHSSDLRITLRAGDHTFDVARVNDKVCLVSEPVDVPPGPGELSFFIDGRERRRSVTLEDGIQTGCREVRLS